MDFRLITNPSAEFEEYKKDFIPVLRILEDMWDKVINYIESNWKNL